MKKVCYVAFAAAIMFSSYSYNNLTSTISNKNMLSNVKEEKNDALAFHEQFRIDLSDGWAVFNGCPGGGSTSDILNGTFHVLVHGVINKNMISYNYQSNIQNLVVAGDDGNQYVGNSINSLSTKEKFNGTYTYKYTETTTLATPGSNNNGIIRYDVFLTIDASGNVKVLVDNFREACQ